MKKCVVCEANENDSPYTEEGWICSTHRTNIKMCNKMFGVLKKKLEK